MQDLIKEFMAQKRFAIVGATDNTKKYGYEIFKNLKSRSYEVYPVNPRLKELEGTKCYPSLADIPVKVNVVDFVVPPQVTEVILKECKRLGVEILDRTMATSLLTEGGNQGVKIVGATGVNTRTGEFYIIKSKATILCMARPTRIWLFSPTLPGISEFRPLQCMGDGNAMAWKIGRAHV